MPPYQLQYKMQSAFSMPPHLHFNDRHVRYTIAVLPSPEMVSFFVHHPPTKLQIHLEFQPFYNYLMQIYSKPMTNDNPCRMYSISIHRLQKPVFHEKLYAD